MAGRSSSFSGGSFARSQPLTPSGGGYFPSGGGGSPTSMSSTSSGGSHHIRGSLSGGVTGVGLSQPYAKRSSIFTTPPSAAVHLQSTLQKLLFNKLHEEIYTVLQVRPKPKPQLDVLASFGVNAAQREDEQAYLLVLTSNNQVKKSIDGFGAPKLHWVKIKAPEHGTSGGAGAGEVAYTHKKFKLLKFLRRIEMSGGHMTAGGGGSGAAGAGGASGTLRKKEEFTLVFRSGDQDKQYQFTMQPTPAAPSSPRALAASGLSSVVPHERSIFVWYCLEVCRSYCGFVPTSNIDTVLYQQLTNEITAYYLTDPPPAHTSGHVRNLVQSVSKNRTATADADSKQLTKSKIEERVIVPSMTQEETQLVQGFLKQIEATMQASGGSQSTAPCSSGGDHAHSYLQELESFLTHKLHSIEHANIQSLFNHRQEAINHRILTEDIQANLLDSKLEEMSLWINHHNAELNKMKKGIELIEKRNMSLDIQEKNQTQLQATLQAVLESLKLDPDPQVAKALEHSLEQPDFSFSAAAAASANAGGKFAQTMRAVKQLDHVLGLEIGEGKLEELAAVKEQRVKYAALRSKFSRAAETALEGIFQEAARKATVEVQKEANSSSGGSSSSSSAGGGASSSEMSTNQSVHRDLRRYMELVRYLERLELGGFLALRAKYTAAMRQVYEVKIRLYFQSLKRCVALESKETRLKDFPDWSPELARSAVRRTENGRNVSTAANAAQSVVLRSGPNAPLSPAQSLGKILATQAFVQALANITPVGLAEERFLKEFFGVSVATTPMVIGTTTAGASDKLTTTPFNIQASLSQMGSTPATAGASAASSSRLGGPRGSVSSSSGSSGVPRTDGDSIKSLMVHLFRELEPELRELSVQASKMDHFYTLEMLVQCERLMQDASAVAASGTDVGLKAPTTPRGSHISIGQCEFLESILTSLSLHLKLTFTSFVDAEIEWFSSLHPNPKRCGVLAPMLKFPAMVDRMENIVWHAGLEGSKVNGAVNTRSQAADTSYQKLASALFRWLDGVAKSDDKYTDIVYIENTSYFVHLFTTPHLTVPALDQFVQKAEAKYAEHLRLYISWSIEYEMPLLTSFWSKLEEQLKSIQPEDIPFASELSKHDLRAVTKGPLSAKLLLKSLTNVLKRVEKHLPRNPSMVHTVWAQIHQTFVARLTRFDQLVHQCYQNEKLEITPAQAGEMFDTLLPPGSVVNYTT